LTGAMPAFDSACPSRFSPELPTTAADGPPPTRWTDPRTAAAYALRDSAFDREVAWPALAAAVRPPEPRRAPGRPDGEVLDLGCGLGGLSHHLASEHWLRVHAVDVSPAMHRLGAQLYRDAWLVRSLPDSRGRLHLRRGQCTGAVVQLMLVHLPHARHLVAALGGARLVLRPGAPLVAVEPGPGTYGGLAGAVQWGEPREAGRSAPEDGMPYVARYRLTDGTTLRTAAWHHTPDSIAECLWRADFRLDEMRPLAEPLAGENACLWLYRATAV
jgi:SAM-dependent methyltransferase